MGAFAFANKGNNDDEDDGKTAQPTPPEPTPKVGQNIKECCDVIVVSCSHILSTFVCYCIRREERPSLGLACSTYMRVKVEKLVKS